MANWIWLSDARYPEFQRTDFPEICSQERPDANFCVAEFRKTLAFPCGIDRAELRVSADIFYTLYLNGAFAGKGPASAGGDFLCDRADALPQYADQYTLYPDGNTMELYAQVRLLRERLPEYSKGHGGLLVEGTVYLTDGTSCPFSTDESWLCRVDRRYPALYRYEGNAAPDEWENAVLTEDVWQAEDAGLEPLTEEKIFPKDSAPLIVPAGETRTFSVEFDRIYAAFAGADICGDVSVEIAIGELPGRRSAMESIRSTEPFSFRSLLFHSVGAYALSVTNHGSSDASVLPYAIFTHYPVHQEGVFRCSDPGLTAVYDLCKWTLRICRQSLHLDSPMHQELLACTGDYYIETLMTAFTFGDMRLAKLDLVRTANWLVANNGVMFHTTYSLIWVQMLLDVYRLDGDPALLLRCLPAIRILLDRFTGYLGENDVIEYAPNYMFVDWTTLDGQNMHHPPKYLGQAVMTAFFCGALQNAAKIYAALGMTQDEARVSALAARVADGYNAAFYDPEQGLYFEGLGTPDRVDGAGELWELPKNQERRYYAAYSNILAVLYGICGRETARRLLRTFASGRFDPIQPYFMHFALEAIDRAGLYEELALPLLEKWKPLALECGKGLKEGWLPMKDYAFDYSHAWGGTPAYQLPAHMLGFRMEEPGFRAISLRPSLLGLDSAEISVPTPFGFIECRMEKGKAPVISVPQEIHWSLRRD